MTFNAGAVLTEKIDVVLVILNNQNLLQTLRTLNFNSANLVAIVVEDGNDKILNTGSKKVPCMSFAAMESLLVDGKNFVWLLNGFVNNVADLWKMKKFLMTNGVPEDNIVNFEVLSHISADWLANLRYIEKYGADFFATGISYTEVGLDLNNIPHVRGRGVNLSDSNQDLLQSYLTAKYVFEHVKPGTIKFVLIGLAPYSFRYDNAKAFAVCSRNLQYMLALNLPAQNLHDELLRTLISDNVKKIFETVTAAQADLNFNRTKNACNSELPVRAVINWEAELKNLTKKFFSDTVEKNFRILKDYIKLCSDHGAKPVGVIFPFAPAMRDNYNKELLTLFRLAVRQFEETSDFICVDLFYLNLDYGYFYNMAHLNLHGAAISSSLLALHLYAKNLIRIEDFCKMSYRYFDMMSDFLPKDVYNDLMSRVFYVSAEMIRRKDKIKLGFVLYDASMWCGDDLYNYFARNERFEPTIFLCLRTDRTKNELVRRDFFHGAEQFKSRGLNVVTLDNPNAVAPAQDVLIYLTPYFEVLPRAVDFTKLTAKTLTTYIPYAFDSSLNYTGKNIPLLHLSWKNFLHSDIIFNYYDKLCKVGVPRSLYSGYPKTDIFFERDVQFHFDWKRAQPNAKKIIWAPHWSINNGVAYATFQWNYRFMYEFAKAHPEISWTVKPHPNLLYEAVRVKVFPSTEAFEEYLQAWNDLPNAQVYTGAYYQDIFATSDGMIHDCGSFIAEYQYVDKPMIYLTRDTQRYNELGYKILSISYLVDGKNFDAIAATIKRVIIDGDDYKAAERRELFDKHLNYPKTNGMLASEFIYKNISEELMR